jgi:hypothetical protein
VTKKSHFEIAKIDEAFGLMVLPGVDSTSFEIPVAFAERCGAAAPDVEVD